MTSNEFLEISPADFFYRNRDLAGFSNPARAVYSVIRELIENSLDACEFSNVLPDIFVRLRKVENRSKSDVYEVLIADNGPSIDIKYLPLAFGKVFYGSKYKLRQSRGTFGLGVTLTILYGQITVNSVTRIVANRGKYTYDLTLQIDIQRNKPVLLACKKYRRNGKSGTTIQLKFEGDYYRALGKVVEYVKQTAIINPHANVVFIDPRGVLYAFERGTSALPKPPKEVKPHPYGIDLEVLRRMIERSNCKNMVEFMVTHFHRVGRATAKKFLEYAGIPEDKEPRSFTMEDMLKLLESMKSFNEFLPPDSRNLSPLTEKFLEAGINKELKPEFLAACTRKASVYSGYPFIVEAAIAYGGEVKTPGITLYRFANKIPLLYDEANDVSWKVINSINWKRYKISPDTPIAIFVHICSTKVPYKTIGKEYIADRPEIEHEIENAIRFVARKLMRYLSKKELQVKEKKRLDIFARYLPKISRFATELAKKSRAPDIRILLRSRHD